MNLGIYYPSMAEIDQRGQDCFPSKEAQDKLPQTLSRSAVGSHLEKVYGKLVKRLPELFDGRKLQQNRGRLSAAFDAIRTRANLPKDRKIDGELLTFGELRTLRRQLNDGINEGLQATSGGATLDESIQLAIVEEFDAECARYRKLIGNQMLFEDAPKVINEVPQVPAPAHVKKRKIDEEVQAQKKCHDKSESTSVAIANPDPLLPLSAEDIQKAPPALIIQYMDGINDESMGGLENDVKPILERLGIPWASYRLWRDNYDAISVAAGILAHGHQAKPGRMKDEILIWVLRSVKMECNNDGEKIAERMTTLGLGMHYAQKQKKRGEEQPRVRIIKQKVEPVIDPRWKFLQEAPRREFPPKPTKVKKALREADQRLLPEDAELLRMLRRMIRAVEKGRDPWLSAVRKLSKSAEEKAETTLA